MGRMGQNTVIQQMSPLLILSKPKVEEITVSYGINTDSKN